MQTKYIYILSDFILFYFFLLFSQDSPPLVLLHSEGVSQGQVLPDPTRSEHF